MAKPQFASAFTVRTTSISAHDKQRIRPAPSAIRPGLFFIASLQVFVGCSVARPFEDEAFPSELQNSLALLGIKRKPTYFAGAFPGCKSPRWYLAPFTLSHSPSLSPALICPSFFPF